MSVPDYVRLLINGYRSGSAIKVLSDNLPGILAVNLRKTRSTGEDDDGQKSLAGLQPNPLAEAKGALIHDPTKMESP